MKYLCGLNMFSELPINIANEISKKIATKTLDPGTIIKYTLDDNLYIILEGRIICYDYEVER